MSVRVMWPVVVVVMAACSGGASKGAPGKGMTQRQRDSAIGASRLPGAQGVRGALRAADSAEARQFRLDSIQ